MITAENCKNLADTYHKENDEFNAGLQRTFNNIEESAKRGNYYCFLVGASYVYHDRIVKILREQGFKCKHDGDNWRISWSDKDE